ncbi:unnamed protein product [Urochloa humidicola]
MVLHGSAVHEAGVLCRGIDFDEVRFFSFLCVDLRFLCELPVAGCARFLCRAVGPATNDMASSGRRIVLSLHGGAVHCCLVRLVYPGSRVPDSVGSIRYSWIFVRVGVLPGDVLVSLLYQHEMKSGWFLVPTNFGGSASLLGDSSSGVVESLPTLAASDSSKPGDCTSRVVQCSRCVSVLACCSRRQQTSMVFAREGIGFKLGAPIAGGEEDREDYKDLSLILFHFEGVLVKVAVITKFYQ